MTLMGVSWVLLLWKKTGDFDKSEWGLPNVKTEIWRGFVFVNLDPDAEPLTPSLSRYESYLEENYQLDEAVCQGLSLWNRCHGTGR